MTADVLIVGGGVAGTSLAILLGRQGIAVELFESRHFPREKACGEGIMPAGVAVLERLGVAGAVGGMPFHGVRYHIGEETAEGRFPSNTGLPTAGLGQRRRHLDQVLFEAAAATREVTVHTDSPVEGLHYENGRVAGVWVKGKIHRAALVVAADGARSLIRHQLGLNMCHRRKRFGVRAHFKLAPNREQPPWVEVFVGCGYELYVTPLPESEVLVAVLADARKLHAPLEHEFQRWRNSHGALAARLEGAKETSEPLSAAPLASGARAGVAPGVVLLGDAAGAIDPITGGGITQALQTAELLAAHASKKLGTDEEWLFEFDKQRSALLRDYAILTRIVLWLVDHPQISHWALTNLNGFPALFSHLIGVAGGVKRLWRSG
jgi:2-polyprenyl-6-methoxyphenol hydroxylase-like FAD-dependent oxidoreductase